MRPFNGIDGLLCEVCVCVCVCVARPFTGVDGRQYDVVMMDNDEAH